MNPMSTIASPTKEMDSQFLGPHNLSQQYLDLQILDPQSL